MTKKLIDDYELWVLKIMKLSPPGGRKRGRSKLTWSEGIRGLLGEKGLME